MEENDILVTRHGHVATVTMNRPEVLNAMSEEHLNRLADIWRELRSDDTVRAVIMTANGRGFCSGADLRKVDMAKGKRTRPAIGIKEDWLSPLIEITKPTVAAVNGVAAGAGLAIALACDVRVSSEAARYSAIFANIAMPAIDGVTWMLPRIVGLSKALEMIMSADILGAQEAERIGLTSYVVPPERLMERAMELAEKFAASAPVAVQLSKTMVYRNLNRSYADHLEGSYYAGTVNRNFAQHDLEEGQKAFREKRRPEFKGLG